jgi:hypothetical protein
VSVVAFLHRIPLPCLSHLRSETPFLAHLTMTAEPIQKTRTSDTPTGAGCLLVQVKMRPKPQITNIIIPLSGIRTLQAAIAKNGPLPFMLAPCFGLKHITECTAVIAMIAFVRRH